ncbi:hypothetical protein QBC33DRAFT_529094 [Phialemonium atrogriseum]|uniref:Uncharacterized protein n=1 Tax=Phialemonium atrogriseum TaxID=1093897 RepID=A0AAJ0FPX9_9PEZI|nr:uncharacterized protein QBC33DRAFT_529094 [Phialemonium atrogriseum]KAK1770728.1 hypothetical protein QBC33DRAFT_529094 [Phialemonium atrogriseum]
MDASLLPLPSTWTWTVSLIAPSILAQQPPSPQFVPSLAHLHLLQSPVSTDRGSLTAPPRFPPRPSFCPFFPLEEANCIVPLSRLSVWCIPGRAKPTIPAPIVPVYGSLGRSEGIAAPRTQLRGSLPRVATLSQPATGASFDHSPKPFRTE